MTHILVEHREPALSGAGTGDSDGSRLRSRISHPSTLTSTALVVATYLVLAVVANWNAWTTGPTRALQSSQDPKLNAWLIAWTPFALTHGVNPFFSHWVNQPLGVNYSANVAVPLLGIIASPVTALWGPVAGVNFLISLAFFTAAIAGYCFVRHWTTWRPAAFLGGLLFGFSPYVVSAGIAHLHTMFVCLIPFIFIVLDEIFIRQRYSKRVLGVALGLLIIAQYCISSELLVTTALLALIAGILVALFNVHDVRSHLTAAVPAALIAVGLAVVVLAYPILYAIRGPLHATQTLPAGQYQSDLLSALIPSSNQIFTTTSAAQTANQFANNLSENGAYLGIPLVVFLLAAAVLCRRSKVVVIGVLLAISAYLLSMGSPLRVGNTLTHIRLPGGILRHIPLVSGAVLARFSVFVFLFAALVLGVAVERLRRWPRWSTSLTGVLASLIVSAVVLAPMVPTLPYQEVVVDTPTFFTTSAVDSVPANSVAVVYPTTTPVDDDATLWQATADMRFKMPGAYALVPAEGGGPATWGSGTLTSGTLQALQGGAAVPRTALLRDQLRAEWRLWDAQTFIMGPGANEAAARDFVTWVIGKPPVHTDGVYVWHDLQRSIAA
ncbi:MAG TPA: hypothetical protein VH012_02750 [Acidimicrobiales bacterium]|nr:hypothetical protein [Acidimicrobiales bacterium]